jgi:hypothetical protein
MFPRPKLAEVKRSVKTRHSAMATCVMQFFDDTDLPNLARAIHADKYTSRGGKAA